MLDSGSYIVDCYILDSSLNPYITYEKVILFHIEWSEIAHANADQWYEASILRYLPRWIYTYLTLLEVCRRPVWHHWLASVCLLVPPAHRGRIVYECSVQFSPLPIIGTQWKVDLHPRGVLFFAPMSYSMHSLFWERQSHSNDRYLHLQKVSHLKKPPWIIIFVNLQSYLVMCQCLPKKGTEREYTSLMLTI